MKINQVNIFINKDGEVALTQDGNIVCLSHEQISIATREMDGLAEIIQEHGVAHFADTEDA